MDSAFRDDRQALRQRLDALEAEITERCRGLTPHFWLTLDEETLGQIEVEPLDRGFGYTFGNSLRRVLLSSLEGAAVTSVKVEGTAHEFTTLPGVRGIERRHQAVQQGAHQPRMAAIWEIKVATVMLLYIIKVNYARNY